MDPGRKAQGAVRRLQDGSPYPDSAAHRTHQLRLVLGLHKLRDPGLTFRVRAAVLHPKYKPAPSLHSDIALLQVRGWGAGLTEVVGSDNCTSLPLLLPQSLPPLSLSVTCSWTLR